jgi:hypothetical protein
MERRQFLKFAVGFAAGATALAATAQAVPLLPQPLIENKASQNTDPAVSTGEEVERLQPQEVRWGHGHHWGWHHHRHWGWRHRHWGWRHRHWGWRRRHWHRHHWRHW